MNIQRKAFILLYGLVIALISGCQSGDQSEERQKVNALWPDTVESYLKEPLWQPMQSYDAAHMLMLPLHCAFDFCSGGTGKFRGQFRDFFERFEAEFAVPLDTNPLREAQFLYLVSRYLVLAARTGEWRDTEQSLYTGLSRSLEYYWTQRPSPHWAYSSDFPNAEKRLQWKLEKEQTDWRFFRAIIDEEYYLMAIAADLRATARLRQRAPAPVVSNVLDTALKAFVLEGRFLEDGRWLMQPGVWSDHKDYRYAGHPQLKPDLEPAILPDIAMDTSHSHRMPLWLNSLKSAFKGTDGEQVFADMLAGFRKQFFHAVWRETSEQVGLPVLTNYLDGRNGIYRYKYANAGEALGYGPFELSYALFQGWYGFLGGAPLIKGYREIARNFPLNESQITFYLGPDTERKRHPLMTGRQFYSEGMAELTVNLSVLSASSIEPMSK